MKRKDRGNSILEIRHTEGILAVKLFSIKNQATISNLFLLFKSRCHFTRVSIFFLLAICNINLCPCYLRNAFDFIPSSRLLTIVVP